MKRFALIMAALLAIIATGCNKDQKFTLKGDLASARFEPGIDSLFLQSDAFSRVISIPVRNGSFSYRGRVGKPAFATLRAVGDKPVTRMIVLEKGTITFQDALPCGTPLNDASSELNRSLRVLAKEHAGDNAAIINAHEKAFRKYLSEHSDDPSAVIALHMARRLLRPAALSDLIDMTSAEIQNDGNVRKLKQQIRLRRVM